MSRFLAGSAALLLIAVALLAGACGERVTPIPTTPGQAPGEVPFSVSSPSAVASSTAVPTRAPIRPREARATQHSRTHGGLEPRLVRAAGCKC